MTSKGKRLTYLIVALGVLVLLVAGLALKRPIVEQWYLWKLDSEDSRSRKDAVEGLHRLGSVRAIPRLSDMLRFPGERENTVRGHAAYVLGKLLVRNEALPYLLILIQDEGVPEFRRVAAWALGEIGVRTEHIVSALVLAANDESEFVRRESVKSLGRLRAGGSETMQRLQEALEDDKEIVRKAAAEALNKIQR